MTTPPPPVPPAPVPAPVPPACFTPGPWDTWHDGCGVYHIDAMMPDDSGEKFMLADNVMGEGNARLIAAAPELLEACEAAMAFLGRQGYGERYCDDHGYKIRRIIRSAMSQATGGVTR